MSNKIKRLILSIVAFILSGLVIYANVFLDAEYKKIDKETRTQCIDGMNMSKTSIGDIFFSDEYNEIRIKCE